MEPNNDTSGLSPYFHHHHNPTPPPPTTATTGASITGASIFSPTNGVVPNSTTPTNAANSSGGGGGMVYPHSVPSAVSGGGMETVKRKRGRPRKYGTPEQAAAAKRLSSTAASVGSVARKRGHGLAAVGGVVTGCSPSSSSYASKKAQLAAFGNSGQLFIPHILTVNAGEDVGQRIMSFAQQSKRELCILSGSGSVSNVSLRQPATSGGSVTYEGQFSIITLSGSYIHAELGGRTGGLSICLASTDGLIIGGGVSGPLTAAGPIEVIVGSFLLDDKKEISGSAKGESSSGKLPSPIGGQSISGISFRSPVDSPHQNVSGSQFMVPNRSMQLTPSHSMEWRSAQQSPENGDFDHIPD